MLDLDVFRNPRFAGASVAVTAVYFCLFGTIFLLTQHLQELLGYGALAAGIRTVPFAAVLIVVANLTPRIVGRFGPRVPIVAGLLVVAVSQLLRIASTPDSGYGIILAEPDDVRRRHGAPDRTRHRVDHGLGTGGTRRRRARPSTTPLARSVARSASR